MDKKELGQYRSICAEIIELNSTIKENIEHSTVRGSDNEFPYLSHSMQVSGMQDTEENTKLCEKVRKLEKRKRDIENFIDGIEDSLTRRIFRLRFIDGMNWVKVSMTVGGGNAPDGVRMIVNRYLQKN